MKIPRLLKFALVGAAGAIINTSLLYILTEFCRLYYLLSSLIALEVAIFFQFIANDFWTFREKRSSSLSLFFQRLLKSNLWRLLGIGVNIFVLYSLTEFLGLYYILSNIAGIFCAFTLNYTLESRLTWR
jgi:dolichol-phosphate mannosyltransferase